MSLIDRLADIGDPERIDRIPVLYFHAMLQELANGEKTQADIISKFDLDTDEQTEFSWLIGIYNSQPDAVARAKFIELMRTIFLLAEARESGYTTNADIVARINRI